MAICKNCGRSRKLISGPDASVEFEECVCQQPEISANVFTGRLSEIPNIPSGSNHVYTLPNYIDNILETCPHCCLVFSPTVFKHHVKNCRKKNERSLQRPAKTSDNPNTRKPSKQQYTKSKANNKANIVSGPNFGPKDNLEWLEIHPNGCYNQKGNICPICYVWVESKQQEDHWNLFHSVLTQEDLSYLGKIYRGLNPIENKANPIVIDKGNQYINSGPNLPEIGIEKLVNCPICQVELKAKNQARHLQQKHDISDQSELSALQVDHKTTIIENKDKLALVDKTTQNTKLEPNSAKGKTKCPHCGGMISTANLNAHIGNCKPADSLTIVTGLEALAGLKKKKRYNFNEWQESFDERRHSPSSRPGNYQDLGGPDRLDANWGTGLWARDHGRFGSPTVEDDYGEDSYS